MKLFNKKFKQFIILFIVIVAVLIGIEGWKIYKKIYSPNIKTPENQEFIYLYVPTNSNYADLRNILDTSIKFVDKESFEWLVNLVGFDKTKIRAGRFRIENNISNSKLLKKLRIEEQSPVKLMINNIRTKEQLAGLVAEKLECDSLSIIELMNNDAFFSEYGLTAKTSICLIIPDTYEFYWNTTAEQFFEKMYKYYTKFWTDAKLQRAAEINFSPAEVSILASIVQAEQNQFNEEKPMIAGLYINRLRINMRLQSDPTLIFALGDFTLKRVYAADKEIDSPYNTYKYTGLPPGPINVPEKSSLDAVLNFQENEYLFMCAKEDFSGYHNFSRTFEQHAENARNYQKALNIRNIYRR